MQQTTKYHFNIIDPSDDFSPEKLNENTQKLEDALIAHEGTVSAALAQHKADTDAALAQRIAAVESGARLFHLAGPVVGNGSTAIAIDLSGIDISKYRALLVFTRQTEACTLSACGIDVTFGGMGEGLGMFWIVNTGGCININGSRGTGTGGVTDSSGSTKTVPWSSLTSISGNKSIYYLEVYGIKA